MPTRYLKPGICDSESINACTPLTETLFYRLLVNVDDFGRMDARPVLVKSRCFPTKEDIKTHQVEDMLKELSINGLLYVYVFEGKTYLQMAKWDNTPRATVSKCPQMSDTCIQLYTDVNNPYTNLPVTVTVTVTETVTETVNRKPAKQKTESATASLDVEFQQFWVSYPKKTGKGEACKAWAKHKPNLQSVLDALAWQSMSEQWTKDGGQFIPNPSTYLNQQRWKDEPMRNLPNHLTLNKSDALADWTRRACPDIASNQQGNTNGNQQNPIESFAVRLD